MQERASGEVPIKDAIAQANEQLGDIVIDDTLAPKQLRELGEALEHVAAEKDIYATKAESPPG